MPANTGGYLVIKRPWPAMSRTIWGDPDRYVNTYWSKYPGVYFTGDGARRDDDGYFWLLGRVDDVLNVSGHRIGTMEVESALVSHPAVAEAAVIGASDPVKGQAIIAFVTPRGGRTPDEALNSELKEHVARSIGGLARPDEDLLHGRAAQDAQRQNHAPAAARHRRRARAGRHDDAARPDSRGPDQGAIRGERRLGPRWRRRSTRVDHGGVLVPAGVAVFKTVARAVPRRPK